MPQNPGGTAFAQKASKAVGAVQAGQQGELITGDLHGTKYRQTYLQGMFRGANSVGVTTSAGLATTYVGLCLSNPADSGVNLTLRTVAGGLIVAPSTITALNLITGFAAGGITVHTTALTPFNSFLTGPAPKALLDSACTLVGTPIYSAPLAQCPVATSSPFFFNDFQGGIIIPPGGYAAIGTNIAGPASGFMGSFEWEEVVP